MYNQKSFGLLLCMICFILLISNRGEAQSNLSDVKNKLSGEWFCHEIQQCVSIEFINNTDGEWTVEYHAEMNIVEYVFRVYVTDKKITMLISDGWNRPEEMEIQNLTEVSFTMVSNGGTRTLYSKQ